MISKEFQGKESNRLIHLFLLFFAIVANAAVVGVSAYFFYKYKMKPALGLETYADKLEKEYVWIADWMTVPSDKIAAINKVIAIDRHVKKESEEYKKAKFKIIDELLFYLDSPGADPKLRDRCISATMELLRKGEGKKYFYPLIEPLIYLPENPSDFWSSQIRQKIFLTLYKIDPCNPDLYETVSSFKDGANLNPAEKMVLSGLIATIQLKCSRPTNNLDSLLRDNIWASLAPVLLVKGGIPKDVKKRLKILKDKNAPYRERGKAAQELGKVKRYKLYVLKEMIKVLKELLPVKREDTTHLSYIRVNILYSLPKLKLCYKPLIDLMNKVWENRYVSTLERSLAAAIIANYNLHCTVKVKEPGKLKR